MAPVRESGTAIAATGGALWVAAATCGPPAPPLPLLTGVEVATEFGDKLAAAALALGSERIPFGSAAAGAAAAGFESVSPLVDLVPVDDEDEDGDEDIGAWSGRG